MLFHLIIRVYIEARHFAKEVLLANAPELKHICHGVIELFSERVERLVEHASAQDLVLKVFVQLDELVHIDTLRLSVSVDTSTSPVILLFIFVAHNIGRG